MSQLISIKFHGSLTKYEKDFMQVAAKDTRKVFKYLVARFGETFKQEILNGKWHITKGKRKQKELKKSDDYMSEPEVDFPLQTTELHVFPVISGAGGNTGRIIIGVVLIVIAVVIIVFFPGATAGGIALIDLAVPLLIAGISTTLGGVIGLLTKPPSIAGFDQASGPTEQKPSFIFNGPTNSSEQGVAVPLVYGSYRTGSVVLSGGVDTVQI